MRNIIGAVLAGTVAAIVVLTAPAVASPSFEQMRKALLTAGELPAGLKLIEDRQETTGDNDFAAWDRCDHETARRADDVRMISMDYATDTAGGARVSLFLGAPGAEEAQSIVSSLVDAARRCPEEILGTVADPSPVTQWVHPRLGDTSLVFGHGAVIAQGDVLLYFSTDGLDDAGFTTLVEAAARKLAKHFPSATVR
ncbi:hypothetical protein [Actinoplanes sp. CA-252034]|uniref:hypothetical protein n=1 Tax=Actinoplanes sp. CA-252034 TaxID=3239906 RepID=UPI003D9975EB